MRTKKMTDLAVTVLGAVAVCLSVSFLGFFFFVRRSNKKSFKFLLHDALKMEESIDEKEDQFRTVRSDTETVFFISDIRNGGRSNSATLSGTPVRTDRPCLQNAADEFGAGPPPLCAPGFLGSPAESAGAPSSDDCDTNPFTCFAGSRGKGGEQLVGAPPPFQRSNSEPTLMRTSSIQDRSFRLMRKRRQRLFRRREQSREDADSGVASDKTDFGPPMEAGLLDDVSLSARLVRMSSIHQKSWEIHRKRKERLSSRKSESLDESLLRRNSS